MRSGRAITVSEPPILDSIPEITSRDESKLLMTADESKGKPENHDQSQRNFLRQWWDKFKKREK